MQNCIDTLIVNYRTPELTTEAVRSVIAEPEVGTAIVVDNDSGDDSLGKLKQEFSGVRRVKLVASDQNRGFGAGNNLAARSSDAKYLLFLNSDAAVRPGGLALMAQILEADPKIGIVAPNVLLLDGKTPQPGRLGKFPTPWRILTRQTTKAIELEEAEWATGAALLVRRKEFLELGGFDERIFMYFEDVELCFRYAQAGYRLAFEPRATVIHRVGLSRASNWAMKRQYYAALHHYLKLTNCSSIGRFAVRASIWPYIAIAAMRGEYRSTRAPGGQGG